MKWFYRNIEVFGNWRVPNVIEKHQWVTVECFEAEALVKDGILWGEIGNIAHHADVVQCKSFYRRLKPGEEFNEVVRVVWFKQDIIELQVGYIELEEEFLNVAWDAYPGYRRQPEWLQVRKSGNNVPVGAIFSCRIPEEIIDVKRFNGECERRPRRFEDGEEGVELPISIMQGSKIVSDEREL